MVELIISTNYNSIRTTDEGESFSNIKSEFFHSEGQIAYFKNEDSEHLYYGVQYGFSHKNLLTNEDINIDIKPLNFVTNGSGTAVFVHPNNPNIIFYYSKGFMGNNLMFSTEFGQNPTQLINSFLTSFDALGIVPNSEKAWVSISYSGDEAEIHEIDYTDLENISIAQITPPDNPGEVSNIQFSGNKIILSKGARVFISENNGNSWTQSSGLDDLDIYLDLIGRMDINPLDQNQISIATSKGIYTSNDQGNNWNQVTNQMVHNVQYSPINNGHIITASHDFEDTEFKVNISKDGGLTWNTIPDDFFLYLTTNHLLTFHFYEDYVDVIVSASGLGVVKFTVDLSLLKIVDQVQMTTKSATIYPNPTKNNFNIASKDDVKSVRIFNLNGQLLLTSNQKKIDVSNLNSGTYIVNIEFKNGNTESSKLIKD